MPIAELLALGWISWVHGLLIPRISLGIRVDSNNLQA
jgi:hypothetical protein